MMLTKEEAKAVQVHCLDAIKELSQALLIVKDRLPEEEYLRIKKAIGLSIGGIQVNIIDPVILPYPELDDLRE